jgi:putative alpha-1,2-mannosidase
MFMLRLCLLAGLLFTNFAFAAERDAVSYVNPLIGTQKSAIGYGGTMPFVSPPFGMTNWTPQTRQNKISVTSYNYDDSTISGFIGTHQPAIWMGDYGYVMLMPQTVNCVHRPMIANCHTDTTRKRHDPTITAYSSTPRTATRSMPK